MVLPARAPHRGTVFDATGRVAPARPRRFLSLHLLIYTRKRDFLSHPNLEIRNVGNFAETGTNVTEAKSLVFFEHVEGERDSASEYLVRKIYTRARGRIRPATVLW